MQSLDRNTSEAPPLPPTSLGLPSGVSLLPLVPETDQSFWMTHQYSIQQTHGSVSASAFQARKAQLTKISLICKFLYANQTINLLSIQPVYFNKLLVLYSDNMSW